MKRVLSKIALIAILSVIPVSSGFAYTITFDSVVKDEAVGSTLSSPLADAIVWDFNSGNLVDGRPDVISSIVADTAAVVQGFKEDFYAPPAHTDKTFYLTVPSADSASVKGSITVYLSSLYSYLGMFWGSIDDHNIITFYNGNEAGLSFTGSQVVTAFNANATANGDQYGPNTNTYVNFYGLPAFDSFVLSSNGRAFEVDNLAVGAPVPEPGTLLLVGVGLAGLAGSRLRRKKQ